MTSAQARSRARVAVLVSGRGSNMAALIEAARTEGYPARIALVLSNEPGAAALESAEARGIATATVAHRAFADRDAFERALDARLREAGAEIVCLAGFMRVLTAPFVLRWLGRLINIHPSLLPAFRGLRTHARALEDGIRIHGCTAHFVVPELDAGPIIAQGAVPVLPGDDEASLGARVLAQEHIVYPLALRMVADGAARLEAGRCILVGGERGPERALLVPPP